MNESARLAVAIGVGVAAGLIGRWISQHPTAVDPGGRDEPWPRPIAVLETLGAAAVCALSLRPDHYSLRVALLSAVFALGLATLASTDYLRRILPNRLTYPLMVLALAFAWAWPDRSIVDVAIGTGFALAVAIGLIVLGVLATGGRNAGGAFGVGDLKVILLIGLLLGWPLAGRALILGAALGGVVALGVLMRTGRGGTMAYGPYLITGALVVLLWPGWLG